MRFTIATFLTVLLIAIFLSFSMPSETTSAAENGEDLHRFYDIRTDRTDSAIRTRNDLAAQKGITFRDLDSSVVAEQMRAGFPELQIEFNLLDLPEVIAPTAPGELLTAPDTKDRTTVLKTFLADHRTLFGISVTEIDRLAVSADYTNPDGKLSFVHLVQEINGIPVLSGEIKAVFNQKNQIARIINNYSPNNDQNLVSKEFGSAHRSVVRAFVHLGLPADIEPVELATTKDGSKITFERTPGLADKTQAEKFYFPLGQGVFRAAWRVLVWTKTDAYYVIIDAEQGTILWLKNIGETQTLPATYNVYGNQTSLQRTADSPSPFSPGCATPIGCSQPPLISRLNFTLVGNEAPYNFNDLGWIPDTGLPVRTPADPNITDGNNVEAGIDRDGVNGPDPNGWARGNPSRVFSYVYNPAPGDPGPGENPIPPAPQPFPPSQFQQGSVTHGFYTVNRWHDEMYLLGFTEQAQNFQHFNFGRGGAEGDRVQFDIQDSSATGGANFFTPADGTRPRMQMFVWAFPTPDRDGALDTQVVVHEMTHGLTSRLHGNSTGLSTNMSRSMGEGWSDFYAFAMLSEPNDDPLGTHALAGYVTYQIASGFEANYYYGIRRFPVAPMASRGPNGLPHNPLTFRYINSACGQLIGTSTTNPNSAFPRGPIGVSTCDQIHNAGEVWAVALWEVRNQLTNRHGGENGNKRALQYVTDGMKISPLNPTMLQSRDAIIAATSISDAQDVCYVWRGFATRGFGVSASIQNTGSGSNNTVVTESFQVPVACQTKTRADFDGDGRSDVSVFRPSDGVWYLNRSTSGFAAFNWGLASDVVAPGDFDGDGKTDIAVFRGNDSGAPDFYVINSSNSTVSYIYWGSNGDVPVVEDFDGDGRSDAAIYRPSTGSFWILQSSNGTVVSSSGFPDGEAVVGDFDGDHRADMGTIAGGEWSIARSINNYALVYQESWGLGTDIPVPADYDGDGIVDLAVFRPSDGVWYIRRSSGGVGIFNWGLSGDIPVPGDYDGDGRSDQAVYRSGMWYINRSTGGSSVQPFGLASDRPVLNAYLP